MRKQMAGMLFWAVLLAVVPVLTGAAAVTVDTGEPAETLIYESPVFSGDGEAYRPEAEMERGGKRYRLITSELQKAVQTGRKQFVSSWVSLSLEGEWDPPGTAEILAQDDDTGIKKEYMVPLLESRETGREWSDDFSFSVTVSGYGADSFWLGETEIPGDIPLEQLGPELLEYLKLPAGRYQVEGVTWAGEPYESEGILCRDAQASGRKLVRNVEARYGGDVELPQIEGLKYYCTYREIVAEGEDEETEAVYARESAGTLETAAAEGEESTREDLASGSGAFAERVLRWLTEHLTVVRIGAVFFAGILVSVMLLVLSGKKKDKER